MQLKKVKAITLGCKVNQYETEAMLEKLQKNDFEIVDYDEIADIYLINTCTVTNLSDRKSRQLIRRSKRENPNSIVVVAGCYSQIKPEEIENMPEVDIIIGTSDKLKISDVLIEYIRGNKVNIVKELDRVSDFEDININNMNDMTRAYIKIQDGCNMFCSYCIIPYARGRVRSRNLKSIADEVKRLADNGYKEIVLTGIHVASYGKDFKDIKLIDAIETIAKVDKIERIRLSSIEPNLIDEDFLKRLKNIDKICDHFHMSLQSGSDKILKLMNRKYDYKSYLEKTKLIRKYYPNAGLTTDIIVGFPYETDEDFQKSVDAVKEINFSKIHVFKYSKREGTPAANMKLQIPGDIKNERSEKLIGIGEKYAKIFNEGFIDKTLDVLFEKSDGQYFKGHSTNYIPIKVKSDKDITNQNLRVYIESIDPINPDGLIGKLI